MEQDLIDSGLGEPVDKLRRIDNHEVHVEEGVGVRPEAFDEVVAEGEVVDKVTVLRTIHAVARHW